jgi:hypothetical protein
MKRLSFLMVPLLLTAISCTKGGGSSPNQTPAQKPPAESGGGNVGAGTTTPDSVTPPGTNPTPEPFDEITENPTPEVCPWNLNSNKTVNAIRALGIRVKADCAAINNYRDKIGAAEIERRVATLDDAIESLKESEYKPAMIVLAATALHDPKKGVLQIGVFGADDFDLRRFVKASLKLMKFELDEFDGRVRFEFNEYVRDTYWFGGKIYGNGSSTMWAADVAFMTPYFNLLKKNKEQILAHSDMFPLVFLIDHVFVDERSHAYGLSLYSKSDRCFDYLSKLKKLAQSYSPTSILVSLTKNSGRGQSEKDISFKAPLISIAESLQEFLATQPIRHVEILGWHEGSYWATPVSISFNEQVLTIENLLNADGSSKDPRAVLDCLKKQDFSAPFKVTCGNL